MLKIFRRVRLSPLPARLELAKKRVSLRYSWGSWPAICALAQFSLVFAVASPPSSSPEPKLDWDRQLVSAGDLTEAGKFDDAEIVYNSVLRVAERVHNDLRTGVALQNLGWMLDRKGSTLRSEQAYLQSVAKLKPIRTDEPGLLLKAYIGLSAVYIERGSLSKAETLIRSVLADFPNVSEPYEATFKGELGVILAHKNNLEEAAQVLEEVANCSPSSSDVQMQQISAVADANRANIRLLQGRLDEAVLLYRRSLDVMRTLPGSSASVLTTTSDGYARALLRQGDSQAAEGVYRGAIAFGRSALGPTSPTVGKLLQDYSNLLRREGRKPESRRAGDEAYKIRAQSSVENLSGQTIDVSALARAK